MVAAGMTKASSTMTKTRTKTGERENEPAAEVRRLRSAEIEESCLPEVVLFYTLMLGFMAKPRNPGHLCRKPSVLFWRSDAQLPSGLQESETLGFVDIT
jgi:hypothetical protein